MMAPVRPGGPALWGGRGYGLPGMRARVAESGTLAVESQPGEGTAVVATLPVRGIS